MRKASIFLFILVMFSMIGCAALTKAAKETTSEQVTAMQQQQAPITSAIPTPWAIPAGILLAVLGAVGKNWWNDKHPKTPTTTV